MADKVANLYFDEKNLKSNSSENEVVWIRCFFMEFIKKWPKIDFYRMDKYIMMTGLVVNKFFDENLQNHNFEQILKIFEIIKSSITSGHYNFSFISVIIKNISHFIDKIFSNDGDVDVKTKFLSGHFVEFFEKLLKVK